MNVVYLFLNTIKVSIEWLTLLYDKQQIRRTIYVLIQRNLIRYTSPNSLLKKN